MLIWFIVMLSVVWVLGDNVFRDMFGVIKCLWILLMDLICFRLIFGLIGCMFSRLCNCVGFLFVSVL